MGPAIYTGSNARLAIVWKQKSSSFSSKLYAASMLRTLVAGYGLLARPPVRGGRLGLRSARSMDDRYAKGAGTRAKSSQRREPNRRPRYQPSMGFVRVFLLGLIQTTGTKTLTPMPHTTFKKGYIAAWQAIRGNDPVPTIPTHHVPAGQTPYRAGVARGVRDALAFTSSTSRAPLRRRPGLS
jgi:hypothetical protein